MYDLTVKQFKYTKYKLYYFVLAPSQLCVLLKHIGTV